MITMAIQHTEGSLSLSLRLARARGNGDCAVTQGTLLVSGHTDLEIYTLKSSRERVKMKFSLFKFSLAIVYLKQHAPLSPVGSGNVEDIAALQCAVLVPLGN